MQNIRQKQGEMLKCRLAKGIPMKLEYDPKIRRAVEVDALVIAEHIADWLRFDVNREASIRRAVDNDELLVAEYEGKIVGFIHFVMHEDIIDGGPNSFITALFVVSEFRNRGLGSRLLQAAIEASLEKGALGVEASTANPEAKRIYEKYHFEQFMGEWTMGEVFLELNVAKYKTHFRTGTGDF